MLLRCSIIPSNMVPLKTLKKFLLRDVWSGIETKHASKRTTDQTHRESLLGFTLKYCTTNKMLADFFTMPLQCELFRKCCDIVLGYRNINTLQRPWHRNVLESGKSTTHFQPSRGASGNSSPKRIKRVTWTVKQLTGSHCF